MHRDRAIHVGRRSFLRRGGILVSAALAAGTAPVFAEEGSEHKCVSPTEDLMTDHGLLRRLLLVYREGLQRLEEGKELDPNVIHEAAGIISSYVEGFHEKLEEDYLFPRFEKAGEQVKLVDVLYAQHVKGRQVTDMIARMTETSSLSGEDERRRLATVLSQYVFMYEHHAAREDTDLFPAFRELMPAGEFAELGERFESLEQQRFGKHGHEELGRQVAALEQRLEIDDLASFTPTVTPDSGQERQ